MSFGGWSILGIGAAVTIVAGIVLLVVYAARRGLVHRELDGVVAEPAAAVADGQAVASRGRQGRTLGAAGAALLAVGLALGLLSAMTGWGTSDGIGSGPGAGPVDCAQSWSGCPQATPVP
jgi:hypothetical protein